MIKKIVVLWPYKFREFDWKRYEFSELLKEQNIEIEIHELIDFLIPHFTDAFQIFLKNDSIKRFKSFKEWKNYINQTVSKSKNSEILILKHSLNDNININFLLINREIKKLNLKTLEFSGNNHPVVSLKKKFDLNYFLNSLYKHFKNPKILIYNLKKNFYNFLYFKFYKKNDYFLIFNKNFEKKITQEKTKIIDANSFDYSLALKNINNGIKISSKSNYALFLEAPTPLHPGDELIWGGENEGYTKEKWFPSLNRFFDELEKKLKLKIIIAPHPKVKHKQRPSYYGGREVSELSLVEAAYNADLIITQKSTGVAFGVIYNKPIMLVTSNELVENKNTVRQQTYFSKELGTTIKNIDEKIDPEDIKKIFSFDKTKYQNYFYNYCTARKDKKRNYQIIAEIVKNSKNIGENYNDKK